MNIINIDSSNSNLLRQPTKDIEENEFGLVEFFIEWLFSALQPYFPAAGLAAPQIGLDRSIFIYSFDRDPKNLEAVINPEYVPVNEEKKMVWEGCISCLTDDGKVTAAKVSRYNTIKVKYLNSQGVLVEKVLDGFEAKAFQHETDHLRGVINIDREEAIVKLFESKRDFKEFMKLV